MYEKYLLKTMADFVSQESLKKAISCLINEILKNNSALAYYFFTEGMINVDDFEIIEDEIIPVVSYDSNKVLVFLLGKI